MDIFNQLIKYKSNKNYYNIDNINNLLYVNLPNHTYIFKLINIINQGEFGIIYKYKDLDSNKYIAIKKLINNDLELLKIELNISFNIDCDGLIKQFPIYHSNNNILFLMELCEGAIYDYKWISNINIIKVLKVLINQFICIIDSGYVYMDLKPEQILYKKDKYILGDIGSIGKLNQHFNSGELGGFTYNNLYLPPELINGNKYIDSNAAEKINVFQIGILLLDYLLYSSNNNGSNINRLSTIINNGNSNAILRKRLNHLNIDETSKYIISTCLLNDPFNRPNLLILNNIFIK